MEEKRCKVCGRKLRKGNARRIGVGPICSQKVYNRFKWLEGYGINDVIELYTFCSTCEHFKSNKRGKGEEFKLHVIDRIKDQKINYDKKDVLAGRCDVFGVFVDGNIITKCLGYESRRMQKREGSV